MRPTYAAPPVVDPIHATPLSSADEKYRRPTAKVLRLPRQSVMSC
ncbi:hypothetical protein DIQ79_05250 [Mycolicibacterium smegmatis]|uniref:Uncharacterized protein n=1 Tax=Mycolicibacterium smegmatis (strain ATCC 700084 / mc(2)155) TaxID=246196 RepID=A0R0F1_MYCS2|nr:hypothetical protein MSMEG_4364 [Mycolicibacterium smegmatis MC2 155]TBM46075.1 hypothetical protein DIQ86_14160 [Mycolicibacterium smegmatis]TBH51466.1 hypothetical protein EYS45_03765 [Mycolicibacterium smegmatis MC2 155]TBM54687.1 hypothetical protein DIQ85_04390 [Mycolicibacterium smegmatis]TBM66113.1 hypothetical protein DIQ83_04410 [Mycolicibacterium smegmatis]